MMLEDAGLSLNLASFEQALIDNFSLPHKNCQASFSAKIIGLIAI